MPLWRRASITTPTRLWLITAVGPPPWATRILFWAIGTLLLPGKPGRGGRVAAGRTPMPIAYPQIDRPEPARGKVGAWGGARGGPSKRVECKAQTRRQART